MLTSICVTFRAKVKSVFSELELRLVLHWFLACRRLEAEGLSQHHQKCKKQMLLHVCTYLQVSCYTVYVIPGH